MSQFSEPFTVDYAGERVIYTNLILPAHIELTDIPINAVRIPPINLSDQETLTIPISLTVDQEEMEKTLQYLAANKHLLNATRAAEKQFTLKQIQDFAYKLGIKPTGGKKALVSSIKNKLVEMGY